MRRWFPVAVLLVMSRPVGAQGLDLNDMLEKATKDAARKVAPSVVQIVTQGGADMVVTTPKGPVFRKAQGPTTGLIVSADGHVISSAFNFINNPTTILVAVPGHQEPYVARRIATDRSRLLTLLKIETTALPVPAHVPNKELRVGQWSIALGRTLDSKRDNPPSVSLGVISALGRIWGKCLQTDAKVSPINYGGPLIDIQGRVQGILIPASPKADAETSGFEWYDSGIGFAVPMEDVLAVLPRLKQGKDLQKGVLGVRLKDPDIYGALPAVAEVAKDSSAARAGMKGGDIIVDIDGQPVVRISQILHSLGTKYEGDKISLKFQRGKETIAVANLELVGKTTAYAHPFLGILPLRDDPRLGVEIRHVYPKSPADKAGLKEGDRIVKIGTGMNPLNPFTGSKRGSSELADILNNQAPGTELKLEVVRKDKKTETVTVTLDQMPGTTTQEDKVPDRLPEPASHKKALEPLEVPNAKAPKVDPVEKAKAETGLMERKVTNGKFWLYVHEDYDPNIAHALLVWLHPAGKHKKDDVEEFTEMWEEYCKENNLILLCPVSDNEAGWVPSDADFVVESLKDVLGRYTIDRERIVTHGMGVGGQMAVYLGFNARDQVRGVVTSGAVVGQPKDNLPNQRLAFYVSGGDRDPLVKEIAEGKDKLIERRFPVIYREIANRGREYFQDPVIHEVARWIDSLDRR